DQTRVDQAHVDQATANPDRARTLMPGRDYVPPAPQAKLAPIDDGQEDYYTRLEQALQVPGQLWKALIAAVAGVSPSQARELAWRATGDVHALAQGTPVLAVVQALQALWGPRESGDWSPGTVHETGTESGLESHNAQARVIGYAPYVLHFRGSFQPQPTLSAAIELALGQAADSVAVAHNGPAVDAYAGLRKQVAAQLQKARRRVERQLAALAADEPAPGEPERLRSQAEWLLALQSQITRGQTELTVEVGVDAGIAGVDADGVLRIPLHATKSPVEQAQQLFKQAGKFTRAAQIIPQRRAQLETDLEFLDQLASDLALAENQPEIATVQQELRATRLLPPTGKPAPRVQAAAEPLRFLSAQGFEVVVGRNARQNELVTFKIAQAEDTWLHARAVPGAHVVIRNGGQTLDSETVVYAAQIAAYYSQARGERAAPVIVTPRKHITRAPGGRKGQVVVRQEETVTVRGELPTDAHAEADKA
ncbi:MAG: NFACT RNA binding domain-containing protein, partial [Litorilinea sp.]